jgi:hypothetical protein
VVAFYSFRCTFKGSESNAQIVTSESPFPSLARVSRQAISQRKSDAFPSQTRLFAFGRWSVLSQL